MYIYSETSPCNLIKTTSELMHFRCCGISQIQPRPVLRSPIGALSSKVPLYMSVIVSFFITFFISFVAM